MLNFCALLPHPKELSVFTNETTTKITCRPQKAIKSKYGMYGIHKNQKYRI